MRRAVLVSLRAQAGRSAQAVGGRRRALSSSSSSPPSNFFDSVGRDWEKAWQKQLTPWDCGGPAPPLVNLLKSGALAPSTGVDRPRALVPGCGSGFDCIELARHGWWVTGADISTTGIEKAREVLKELEADEGVRRRVSFEVLDFYAIADRFHLVYDYTFLCALPPDHRPRWAKKMKQLVEPGQGELVTLIFPVQHGDDPARPLDTQDGPPFEVNTHLYKQLLLAEGFECTYMEPCRDSIKPRMGREWLGRWRLPAAQGHKSRL